MTVKYGGRCQNAISRAGRTRSEELTSGQANRVLISGQANKCST